MLFLRARELPRGALVEFQCNLHSGRRSRSACDPQAIDDEEAELKASYSHAASLSSDVHWEVCETNSMSSEGLRAVIFATREPGEIT